MSGAPRGSGPVPRSERIKVLQLTGITVGGSAEHLLQLATLLPPDRFETTIALSGGGPLDDAIRSSGLPVLDYAPSHGAGTHRSYIGSQT